MSSGHLGQLSLQVTSISQQHAISVPPDVLRIQAFHEGVGRVGRNNYTFLRRWVSCLVEGKAGAKT